MLSVLIMAAGLGKRMNSEIPKVLHCLNSKPMLIHIIEKCLKLNPEEIVCIVNPQYTLISQSIEKYFDETTNQKIRYIVQDKPLGTGSAVLAAKWYFANTCKQILVLPGDVPLVKIDMLKTLWESHIKSESPATILITHLEIPTGNGRIITDRNGHFTKIQEEKDCSEEEKLIQTVNAGIYVFDSNILYESLPLIKNENAQREYYLTDIFEILHSKSYLINTVFSSFSDSLINVNSQKDLEKAMTYS